MLGKRFYPLFAMLIVLTVCVTACRDTDVEPAQKGSLLVYTSLGKDYATTMLEAFTAKYPKIEVTPVFGNGDALVARLIDEQEAPKADVLWGIAATHLLFTEWKGLLEAYSPEGLDRIDSRFRDVNNPPYWVGVGTWTTVLCINTVEMEKRNLPIPESWADLVHPNYKGQVVMPSPLTTGIGYLFVSGMLQLHGEVLGWEYLDALDKNIDQYTLARDLPSRLVGEGRYPIAITYGYAGVIERHKGNPVEIILPAEGVGWELEANALINKKEIEPAAKTFLDWAISDEALLLHTDRRVVLTAKTDGPVPDGFPPDTASRLLDIDLPWVAANHQRILKKWQNRYTGSGDKD